MRSRGPRCSMFGLFAAARRTLTLFCLIMTDSTPAQTNGTNRVRQFSIGKLAEWTVIAALTMGLAVSQSSLSVLLTSLLLVPSFVAYKCWRMRINPITTGAITGFSWPAALCFCAIVTTVREAEIVQGQLYTEDGPVAFFAGCAIFLTVFGGLFSILGMIGGAAIHFANSKLKQEQGERDL